jgi:hypothetical protein
MAGYIVTLNYTFKVPIRAVSQANAIEKAKDQIPQLLDELGLPDPKSIEVIEAEALPPGLDLWYGVRE